MAAKSKIVLDGESLTLAQLEKISKGATLSISNKAKGRIQASYELVKELSLGSDPVYGVNTGFGFFANIAIDLKSLKELQLNIIKSHAAGWGPFFSLEETKAMMALRLNVLVKGYTGVRFELCQALLHLINAGIYPLVPEYGSVGASGDLAPLAHLALPLVGLGKVFYKNKIMSAKAALKLAKLAPVILHEKEGLGLINGTQGMLAQGGLALISAKRLLDWANRIVALTYEAMNAGVSPLSSLIQQVRGQKGQITAAKRILRELQGSYLFKEKKGNLRVQEPYSLRCAPQIHGPCIDALDYATTILEIELNSATDNPLVFPHERKVLSGGNFHGECLAFAFDFAGIAISEIGNVSERRLELLLNPHMSGLPAFLSPHEGLNSGYMALQYLSASLVNENKLLGNPASTDSIPGNVGIEDHVSMGMTSARKFKKIVKNTQTILSCEWLAASQAIDLRRVAPLGKGTKKIYRLLREHLPMLKKDRIIAEDVKIASHLFKL